MLFTFPSRYWFTIGLSDLFSLAGWSRRIRAEFLVFRGTQDSANLLTSYDYATVTLCGVDFQQLLLRFMHKYRSPTTPIAPKRDRFGLLPVRSPLLRESRLFSFPVTTKMFQFITYASLLGSDTWSSTKWVVPFGNSGVNGYLHLTRTYRSLSRPSSPPRA